MISSTCVASTQMWNLGDVSPATSLDLLKVHAMCSCQKMFMATVFRSTVISGEEDPPLCLRDESKLVSFTVSKFHEAVSSRRTLQDDGI